MLENIALTLDQRQRLAKAAASYEDQLRGDEEAIGFLRGRGFSGEAAKYHRFGVVRDPLPGHEQFRDRISIPYMTRAGVVKMKYRALDDDHPLKYHGDSDAARLYNVRDLERTPDVVVIAEGELDAAIMSSMVGVPCVGVPGVHAWKEHMSRCFVDVPRVIICADNDAGRVDDEGKDFNPGQNLAKKIRKELGDAEIIPPPDNLDINDWFLRDGADEIRRAFDILTKDTEDSESRQVA